MAKLILVITDLDFVWFQTRIVSNSTSTWKYHVSYFSGSGKDVVDVMVKKERDELIERHVGKVN